MPRIEDILFIAIFFAVIRLGPRLMNMDGDLGRHLTIGNFILDGGTIPTKDIFSHTMQGLPLTPHEWLAQVVFALAFRVAGFNGVVIFCASVLSLTFTLVYRHCIDESNMLLVSLGITIFAAAAASIHWLARPHLFTMLFTIIWMGELERWRKTNHWRWWLLPILMLVWVNVHGAFIVGILLWGIYLVDHFFDKWDWRKSRNPRKSELEVNLTHNDRSVTRQYFSVGIFVVLITFLNPAGWRIWETTIGFLQNQYLVSHTVEYQSPNFQQISTWPFLGMIFLSILLLSIKQGRMPLFLGLLIAVWTAFGLVSARNIALYAVIITPFLAGIAAAILHDSRASNKIINFDYKLNEVDRNLTGHLWALAGVFLISTLILGGVRLDSSGLGNKFSKNVFPVDAVDWFLEQPDQGKVFNYFPWGGYLLYRAWPQQQVFIDGQTDFYGEDLTRQYDRVITLNDGWQEILQEYDVGWVIMPSESKLSVELDNNPYWERRYIDQTAAVYFVNP
jgi:hypothetical protein